MKRTTILLVILTLGLSLQAQTFIIDGIGYTITSDSTCGVYSCTTSVCNIPPSVSYDSVEYTVNAIYGYYFLGNWHTSASSISYSNGMWGYRNNGSGHMYNNNTIQIITIPYTIKDISYNALNGLSALTEVHWNATNAQIGYLYNTTKTIFYGCDNLTTITIGDSVKRIPNEFLKNRTNISSIIFPDKVEEIGAQAFAGCIGLSNVSLSNNMRTIGDSAFYGCTGLFEITIPDSVRTIGTRAFYDCSNLYSLSIGRNVESFGQWAFRYCTSLHNVTYNARNASYLSTYYLFENSNSISNLTIGNEVESIPPYFMSSAPNIHNVVFPEGLTHIGNNAFYNCGLEELVISSSVTNIGQNAFYNNTNISRIVSLPTIPPAIYQSTFSGVPNNVETVVPCGASSEYNIRPWWNGMANVKETCRYSIIQDTICDGEIYVYGANTASVSGTYHDTIHIDPYVDSMITVQLVVNPSYDYTLIEQICNGQVYASNGFNENTSGEYVQHLQSIQGCDSIVRLNLTVNQVFDTTIVANICQGDSYAQYGFNTSMAGTYSQNLSSVAGCDSVVHLQLAIDPTYSEHLSATITNIQSYQFVDSTLTQSGVYQKLLHTHAGCDSLLTLTLTVIPSVDTLIIHDTVLYPDTIIVVDTLLVHDTSIVHDTTIVVDTMIVYIDTLVVHDTIYVTDTIVPCPVYRTYIHASIGMGETYSDYGFNVSTAGVYYDTLQTTDGCDSIVCLFLTQSVGIEGVEASQIFSIYPNPTSSSITISVSEGTLSMPINIIDNSGKVIMKKIVSTDKETIDVSTLPAGVYYVRIGETTDKLIIK